MRPIFVGGPGRSGTSFLAASLARHPAIFSFPGIELKFLTEKNGLLDLHHSIVKHYSPNRAIVAWRQFHNFYDALVCGRFGQPGLSTVAPLAHWDACFVQFANKLTNEGHVRQLSNETFIKIAREFLIDIFNHAKQATGQMRLSSRFLEKTPHSILEFEFLEQLTPSASFLHVMRDPRSIAYSLRSMTWGPASLDACASWVSSYCEAFLAARSRAARVGCDIVDVRIEDIARNPTQLSINICKSLGLQEVESLLSSANLSTLNGWSQTAPQADNELLQSRLLGWSREFGYEATEVGLTVNQADAA